MLGFAEIEDTDLDTTIFVIDLIIFFTMQLGFFVGLITIYAFDEIT